MPHETIVDVFSAYGGIDTCFLSEAVNLLLAPVKDLLRRSGLALIA